MTKQPKYPIEPTDEDDQTPATSTIRDQPPPYGAPAFRHRHEIRAPLASGADAYFRAYPHFDRAPRKRGPARRVRE